MFRHLISVMVDRLLAMRWLQVLRARYSPGPGSLTIASGGSIINSTFAGGAAGPVTVDAGNLTITVLGPAGDFTGIASNSEPGATGPAGSVVINADKGRFRSGRRIDLRRHVWRGQRRPGDGGRWHGHDRWRGSGGFHRHCQPGAEGFDTHPHRGGAGRSRSRPTT